MTSKKADRELPGLHQEADPSEWPAWTDQRWEPALGPGERDLSNGEAVDILRGVRAERICRSLAMRGLAGPGVGS